VYQGADVAEPLRGQGEKGKKRWRNARKEGGTDGCRIKSVSLPQRNYFVSQMTWSGAILQNT